MAKILIAEDDSDLRLLVSLKLESSGHEVVSVEDGSTAAQHCRTMRPDLVILDLMMPQVDGFTVVERLRADPATAAIPIVILTAKSMTPEEKARLNGQISCLAQKAELNHTALVDLVRGLCAAQAQ